ncbi:flagellar hook-associated protein FlgL [Idiomarina xiamenensis]|uniref:Flagellar hook-associated protein FlgL n=1 Tax=Idiomarina xiamenensis 10-D-4 TaxID=740709 RepID=K2JFD9_9GAMM|nr:flagellar hook-associated protein FlgL [Idiomarina xiamenensis]EKE82051.1 flagellar hook-associated protein FlgL [Idiomarina xiamenensis 10-D-4]
MRVSTNQIFNNNLQRLLNTQAKLVRDENMLQEQTRILTPGDDPAGAATVLRLNERVALNAQYMENTDKVANSLSRQESVLDGITKALQRAQTLSVQAGNGALAYEDRVAVGTELAGIEQEILDLMNTKDEFGNYLFSGFQGDQKPVGLEPASAEFPFGSYSYNGDSGHRELQVSNSLSLQVSSSGAAIFESAERRANITPPQVSAGTADVTRVEITDQQAFDSFYASNYRAANDGSNDFEISVIAGAPDTYEISQNGTVIQTGNYTDGEAIDFNGAAITLDNAVGSTVEFSFQQPKGNILTSLRNLSQQMLSQTSTLTERQQANVDFDVHAENAMDSIDGNRSKIGSRMNLAQSVKDALGEQDIADKETIESVAGLDMAEGISRLIQTETSLQSIQATFTRVTSLSLFDYL